MEVAISPLFCNPIGVTGRTFFNPHRPRVKLRWALIICIRPFYLKFVLGRPARETTEARVANKPEANTVPLSGLLGSMRVVSIEIFFLKTVGVGGVKMIRA
jgi:hypothetical protein